MFVMGIIIESVALVIGSMLVAFLLCWTVSAHAARQHSSGRMAILALLLFSTFLLSGVVQSEFLKLSAICCLVGAVFLWLSSLNPDSAPSQQVDR